MNLLFRILVAVYAFISTILWGVVMISPFGSKNIMNSVIGYVNTSFYQSNQYDVLLFIIGFLIFSLNVLILFSGIKGKRSVRYICKQNEAGEIRISSHSIENIALAVSKKFQGVKEAKSKVVFNKDKVNISVKLTAMPDVRIQELCNSIQKRIKESVESSMELSVEHIKVSVDSVYTGSTQD